MIKYNDVLNLSIKYCELNNQNDIQNLDLYIKNIAYPSLVSFCNRQFHLVYLEDYATGNNTIDTIEIVNANQNEDYTKAIIEIIDGQGATQRRRIISYDAQTRIATVPQWTIIPDNTSRYVIYVNDNETMFFTGQLYVDFEIVYPPEYLTPINRILDNNFELLTNVAIKIRDGLDLYKVYDVYFNYGYMNRLYDIESILVMLSLDFWKRKGRHGYQGIDNKAISIEDKLTESNYLKEIFTKSYIKQLAKYIVPYDRSNWI